jgi:hypothetical protein
MDPVLPEQILVNQHLLKEEIDLTRLEIGQEMVAIGDELDELQELLYGPENDEY